MIKEQSSTKQSSYLFDEQTVETIEIHASSYQLEKYFGTRLVIIVIRQWQDICPHNHPPHPTFHNETLADNEHLMKRCHRQRLNHTLSHKGVETYVAYDWTKCAC